MHITINGEIGLNVGPILKSLYADIYKNGTNKNRLFRCKAHGV